jgi:hypothetical protein
MAAVLTGTPVAIIWAAGINPAGQSITIPADATAVYMFWTYYEPTDGRGIASVTLNGLSPDQILEIATGSPPHTDAPATGVAAWYLPATGARTLNPAWDIAPSNGPVTAVAFVKDGNTTAWGDADVAHNGVGDPVTVTLTTVSGDLVIKMDQKFGGTVPSLSASWTNQVTGSNNNESMRLSTISATGTTTVCDSEDESYSTIAAVTITAAGGGVTLYGRLSLLGVGR